MCVEDRSTTSLLCEGQQHPLQLLQVPQLQTSAYTKHFFSPKMTKLLKVSNHALIGALLTRVTPFMLQNL